MNSITLLFLRFEKIGFIFKNSFGSRQNSSLSFINESFNQLLTL